MGIRLWRKGPGEEEGGEKEGRRRGKMKVIFFRPSGDHLLVL